MSLKSLEVQLLALDKNKKKHRFIENTKMLQKIHTIKEEWVKVNTEFNNSGNEIPLSIFSYDVPPDNVLINIENRNTELDDRLPQTKININSFTEHQNKTAYLIIEKALFEKHDIDPMPKKILLKIINQTYTSLTCVKGRVIGLPNYLYVSIMNEFGLKTLAERKYLQIIFGCMKYVENKRIQIFGKFLGLYEQSYAYEDYNIYLRMFRAALSP